MSEIEALEYRLALLHNQINYIIGIICAFVCIIVSLVGIVLPLWTAVFVLPTSIVSGLFAGLFTLKGIANEENGRARRIVARLGTSFEDPPLNEWLSSLEDKNSFPVDGETND